MLGSAGQVNIARKESQIQPSSTNRSASVHLSNNQHHAPPSLEASQQKPPPPPRRDYSRQPPTPSPQSPSPKQPTPSWQQPSNADALRKFTILTHLKPYNNIKAAFGVLETPYPTKFEVQYHEKTDYIACGAWGRVYKGYTLPKLGPLDCLAVKHIQ